MLLEHFVPYCNRSSYSFLLELNGRASERKRERTDDSGIANPRFYLCNWACKFALNADTYFLMFTYFSLPNLSKRTNERLNEWTPFYSIIACLSLLCWVYSFFVFLAKSAHQSLTTAMNAVFISYFEQFPCDFGQFPLPLPSTRNNFKRFQAISSAWNDSQLLFLLHL